MMIVVNLFVFLKGDEEQEVILFKVNENVLVNKNMEIQLRYYSIKKRCYKVKV